jgi:energy-coupling factor transporter ATP-binding protein EcfA2
MDIKVLLLIGGFIVIAIYLAIDSKRKHQAQVLKKLTKGWGKPSKRTYAQEEYENISHYYEDCVTEDSYFVDDITWNDLDMDTVFKVMNNTNSSVGQEYLYKTLRMPAMSQNELDELNRLAEYFDGHEKERVGLQKEYVRLGFAKHISLSDYIGLVVDLTAGNNYVHYLSMIFLVASIIICFTVNPSIGIGLIVVSTAFSITSYYRYKAKVESYFICIKHIVRLADMAGRLEQKKYDALKEYNDSLKDLYQQFQGIVKNSGMLESGNVNGSIFEVAFDYIRMLTHVDLIKFNNCVHLLQDKQEQAYQLFEILGKIEASMAIASFRKMLPYWTRPHFISNGKDMKIKEAFHPLIAEPVPNSISTGKHVLLTGSNASGKSTFLKTIAINAILSQSIDTSMAKEYVAPFYRIYSSMSLRDDLGSNDSYYIVEIKSLKRILDAVDQRRRQPVLCFIDEVLRGTNTVERIAASSEILKSFKDKNVLCFAATHDIELTAILEKNYDNYHFQEEVTDNDVKFNYKLFKGPATTRNAIKLLNIIGYDKEIIRAAEMQAGYFIDHGIWKM